MNYFIRIFYYVFARNLPKSHSKPFGFIAKFLRWFCAKNMFEYVGKNVNIEKGAYFGDGKNIHIGNNSGLGVNSFVPNDIVIGDNVMIGPNFYVLARNHNFSNIEQPIISQGYLERKKTVIEDDVWIGREVLFTPGRVVKKGTIIGARCLLTKDFPEYSIVGGNPSKLIRNRKNQNECK